MGRANQLNSGGGIFHVTHRCHNRAFLRFGETTFTRPEEGPYLWRCLCQVELNMVRCGVVSHPREWEWLGCHEIMGSRRRYRLVDLDRLCWRLATAHVEEVRHLQAALADAIARGEVKREPMWTESLAVGSAGFVERIKPMVLSRRETEVVDLGEVSILQEPSASYGQKSRRKGGGNDVL